MLRFFSEHWGDLLVLALLAAAVAAAVRRAVRRKRAGCGCGCADCPAKGSCHPGPDGRE